MTINTALWDVTVCSFADTDVSKQSDAFMTTLTMEMKESITEHTRCHVTKTTTIFTFTDVTTSYLTYTLRFFFANTRNSFNFSRF